MKFSLYFLGVLTLAGAQTTDVSQCIYQAGAESLPINTHVIGCTTTPCLLHQETDVYVDIIFRSPRRIEDLRTVAWAYILGPIGAPYVLGENALTCNFLTNTYCPLLEGEVVQYTLRMHIESWMAAGTAVTIEFVIRDNSDSSAVVCIRMPIQILPPIDAKGLKSHNATVIP